MPEELPLGQRGRRPEAAVAADEFAAVRSVAAARRVHREEGDPSREFHRIGIAREQRSAAVFDLRDQVHGGLVAQIAQHPFDIAGDGQFAGSPGQVADLQQGVLDRRVERHVDPELAFDTLFAVLEAAVAEAVARHVRAAAAPGPGRGGPVVPGFIVAQVQGLAAGVANRIVVPGGQAELVGVQVPGVGAATFRDDRTEQWICQHIDPGGRSADAGLQLEHVLAAVAAEAAIGVGQAEGGIGRASRRPRRLCRREEEVGVEARPAGLGLATQDLVVQGAGAVVEDDPRDGLDQGAVFRRELLRRPHEDSARPVDQVGFGA
ncbi:hypothetical protein D3C84_693890 [compost metagenome]